MMERLRRRSAPLFRIICALVSIVKCVCNQQDCCLVVRWHVLLRPRWQVLYMNMYYKDGFTFFIIDFLATCIMLYLLVATL